MEWYWKKSRNRYRKNLVPKKSRNQYRKNLVSLNILGTVTLNLDDLTGPDPEHPDHSDHPDQWSEFGKNVFGTDP